VRTNTWIFFIIVLLFAGRFTPLYECSAATFTFDKVNSMVLVHADEGNDKIIQETNNYHFDFEKAIIAFSPNEADLLSALLDTVSDFTLDYTIHDSRFRKSAAKYELCLENFTSTIDKEKVGVFDNSITADMQADIYLISDEHTEHLKFQCQASVVTTGLTTNFFVEHVLLELYLTELHQSMSSYVKDI